METGFAAFGMLCLLYYFFLGWYSKKLNSTFAWFWILLGGANLGLSVLVRFTTDWFDKVLLFVLGICWVIFFLAEILILCAMVVVPQKKLKYIVILGAQIRGRRITDSLKRRLDKGLFYLQENPQTICIVSGGRGKGEEISEAEAMAEYQQSCGVAKERIRMEDCSTTTWENLEFCCSFVDDVKKDKVGIVTNNFHIYRSMKMARAIGYRNVFVLPATTNPVVFLNYMVREFFALFVMISDIRKHV